MPKRYGLVRYGGERWYLSDKSSPATWCNTRTDEVAPLRLHKRLHHLLELKEKAKRGKMPVGPSEDVERNHEILNHAQEHRHPSGAPNLSQIAKLTGASRTHVRTVLKKAGMLE